MKGDAWVAWSVPIILRWRWRTVAVVAAITAAAVFFACRLTIDTSLATWFIEDHATIVTYKEFRQRFGEDEFILVAVTADDVFTPEVLAEVDRLTRVAARVPRVRSALSLTNVEVLRRYSGFRTRVVSSPLVRELPKTREEAVQLRKEATSYPLVAGNLVSGDGRAAAIVVELGRDCDTFQKKAEVVRELEARCKDHLAGVTLHVAGSPVLSDAISRHIEHDLRTLTPASFLVVVVATFLLFRRVIVPLISLMVVGLATLWVVGLMGMLGLEMNLLGPVMIMVILVVGVADSVHIFSTFFFELEHAASRTEAIDRALRHVLRPCLFTSLTTIAGFLSLLSSRLEPIRVFGALAALGTTFAFFLSALLIPSMVQLVPMRKPVRPAAAGPMPMDRFLWLLGHPSRRSSLVVMILSTAILVPAVLSIRWIEVTANPMNYFRPDDRVRRDAEAVDAALGGSATLEFIVRAPDGGLKDLRVLRRLDDFEVWLAKRPAVSQVMSLGTLLKEADRVRSGDPEGELPGSEGALRIARAAMENATPDLLRTYVQDDYSLGRISVRVEAADADRLVAQAPDIERIVVDHVNGPDLVVQPTGFVILMDDMRTYLIDSQITSISLAFATITVMLWVLFRSWKLALFSMIPNVGPIVMGLALMAVLGIRLDPGTVMIATIALGLVVDDTCHFLVRLRQQADAREHLPEAIAETMRQTGRPIILSSVILASGFAALVLGSFTPTICFGLVSAFVLLTALAADLVVLPAALLIIRPRL